MAIKELPGMLEAGEPARLFPVVSDSQKEQKIVSAVLGCFRIVPEFALALLGEVGAPAGKTAKISCYTEVVFKRGAAEKKRSRPDGLVIVTLGKRIWTAIIEAKSGNARLTADQVEEYLLIARVHNVDAVITISNQYAVLPTHHPLEIPKHRRKAVDLFHFSWAAIATRAIVLSDTKKIADTEQSFLLKELIRFLQHDSSGVLTFQKMSRGWKETASSIQQRIQLKANDQNLQEAIGSWHELTKFICLELSSALGESVAIKLPRSTAQDQGKRFAGDVNLMIANQLLKVEIDIPNTAGIMKITADFLRRVVILSVEIDAPQDRTRARATINWLTRQLPARDKDSELLVRAKWPNRTQMTTAFLSQVRETPDRLIGSNVSRLPRSFEIIRTLDMSGRFIQSQNFVDDVRAGVPMFYQEVIQHLKEWTPSAPRIKQSETKKKNEEKDLAEVPVENSSSPGLPEHSEGVEPGFIPRADEIDQANKDDTSAILKHLSSRMGA